MAREYLTVKEAAVILKVRQNTVRDWLKTGKLKGYKVGRVWRLTEEAISNFVENKGSNNINEGGLIRMEKIQVKVHRVKPNGYFTDEATKVAFEGKLLATNKGFRGKAIAYLTKQGNIAIVYESSLLAEKALREHSNLADVAKYTEGYTEKKYPDYDQELINKIAESLGEELPIKDLDI